MSIKATFALALTVTALLASGMACAQEAPPGYKADPAIYKLVFEDVNFRIVAGTLEPGQTDKPHSNLAITVAYALTDCSLRISAPDGKFAYINAKAGTASTVAYNQSHTATNEGATVCRVLLIERK